ncbi:phage holin family protein [Gleimia sp. 6138-11-ORH1]|uniref:phage holin family protein n=1 Tax=Gleimia sp. 6138-11-ORH1 TaxID=2973937 RepID=UPI0021687DE3|nr:phage holin family protein [Gleimia sp. 6138-11-ORH1]MCS4484969.1 phage holin family protein [Gleimia sp. 6138-11-ORH1]
MKFLLKLLGTSIGVWVATLVVPNLHITDNTSTEKTIMSVVIFALALTIVNSFIRPIVKFISIPLYILTLGIFSLIVNALMFMLASWISTHTQTGIVVETFWAALFGALITSVISWILYEVLERENK